MHRFVRRGASRNLVSMLPLLALGFGLLGGVSAAWSQEEPSAAPPDPPASAAPGGPLGGSSGGSSTGPEPAPASGSAPRPVFLDTTDRRMKEQRPAPTPEQLRNLELMRRELERFRQSAAAYQGTVDSLVRREYYRQRQTRDEGFAKRILFEEKAQAEARNRAIKAFEKFIEEHPNEPVYTPDAMFRLGELYYERSALEFQEMMAARDKAATAKPETSASASQPPSATPPRRETPDFTPTVQLYHQLVDRFPEYRNIGGVYYLMGYCLNEMGETEQARVAWLSLVCANRFKYEPVATTSTDGGASEQRASEQDQQEQKEKRNPSLTLDKAKRADADEAGPFVDPYDQCTPVRPNLQYVAETWLRIGEYHFDLDFGRYGLDRAISAYRKLLEMPQDRNYNLALYKLAWSYYRASRYPEAITYFGKLVEWSDEEQKRTGKAGSELRAEAIQYLGIAFAYDDWNENQVPDVQEGLPSGLDRVQQPALMPQNASWTPEVYFQLGNIYFEEAKYKQAIEAWELSLRRFPLDAKAPELQHMIARAYIRDNQMDQAVEARAKLSNYGEGSSWWNANLEHPDAQRRAEELAEGSLIGSAVYHHTNAQKLRWEGVQNEDPAKIIRAQQQYALAAKAYRAYLKRYPNNPQAYELRYNLADALFWSDNFDQAAVEYAAVRDSNLDDTHLSEAARRVVESYKRMLENAERTNQVALRTEAPTPQGTPPQVATEPMPELVQKLAQAREVYLARVDKTHDTEQVRESYDYNNTLLLYQYGYWPQAKERFERIFHEHCKGAQANETARVAWLNLRNMAVAYQNTEEVERLGRELQDQKCTFQAGATAVASLDCSQPANKEEPQCLAGQDLTNIKYQRAVEVFESASKAKGAEQTKLYEQASAMLTKAVNEEPNHPQAPLALEKAAIALERINRFESAGKLYQRIIDEVGPKRGANADEQKRLDAILGNAYFRLGYNANRFFDYDRAVENYRILADSKRFSESADTGMRERQEGAMINAATILEYQQQYGRAADYYKRAGEMLQSEDERRAAKYRVAEMSFKQKQYVVAIREMNAFIQQYKSDPKAGELLVQARWRIAESRRALKQPARDYRAALQDVVQMFAQTGGQPGSAAAEYAAQANFQLVNDGSEEFERFEIKPGRPSTMQKYVSKVTEQIDSGSKEAKTRAEAYNTVVGYRRPNWTIAAFVRQGRIYEVLAKAVLNTPFVMPADLESKVRRAPAEAREEVRIQVEDSIRQVLDKQVRPIECLAVARYALAARAARAGSLDTDHTRQAIDRLQAYGDERISECIAQAAQQDASFAPYKPGEFARAPRGQHKQVPAGMSAPALAPLGDL